MTSVSDPQEVKQSEKSEKSVDIQLKMDYKSVLETRSGRNVLFTLLSDCNVYSSIYAEGSAIYFNEGMRNVGLSLIDRITAASPSLYLDMLRENQPEVSEDE